METPCIKTCVIDPADGLCTGCRRSRHEIARWSAFTDTERRAIMDALKARPPATARSTTPDTP
ncbi:DUF1289 domain-containing protein [Hyphomicrobium sp.]|jgi:predicted Fe-S protein YdhL (DUF1289 family)|uniref:DUF1289 domain-containing protein n=1 Tax=Hyphomicrobium sp. TaxID=82 RepID=UPI002FDEB0B3